MGSFSAAAAPEHLKGLSVHFVYICADYSGGATCNADSWAGAPIVGHRYRFKIVWHGGSWEYTIKDLTAGTQRSTSIAAHFRYGNTVWWGGENKNSSSTFGPPSGATYDTNMYWMQYYDDAVAGWTVIDHNNAMTKSSSTYAWPSFWQDTIYSQNYPNDALNLYTVLH